MGLEKVHCGSTGIPVEEILHMNGGDSDYSYANNSSLQENVISIATPLIESSIAEIYCHSIPQCLKFADFGCSSGPNAYLPTWEVVKVLDSTCQSTNRQPPMLQVFLNDLPGNDFNSIFKSLPRFYERLKKEKGDKFGQHNCFIAAVPGSFYKRLLPPNSLHFVFSSYSLHWLSQVPKELVSESGMPMNKGNIYIAKTSPPDVHKAYLDQFENDFTSFLKFRSQELKPGGRMALTLMGDDKHNVNVAVLLGMALNDMVSEGLIEESKLDSFNMPFYAPCAEEVRHIIRKEGSFNIHQLEIFHVNWVQSLDKYNKDVELDKHAGGKQVADTKRAVSESLLASHFGKAVMDDIFRRFSIKIIEYLEMEPRAYANLLISLIKK